VARERIEIPKGDLERLYYLEKKSKYKIGAIYNCSFKTVLNRMREFGMRPLHRSVIQSRYTKTDFNENIFDKAYLIGFRLGDLNVYKTSPNSQVVIARCSTTTQEQIDLLRALFEKYGKVTISKGNHSYGVNCLLNSTFDFLLPKNDSVETWITKHNKYSTAFAAGYVDAEGNVKVYDGRARFKIDSYDKGIIHWFYDWFLKNAISCPKPSLIGSKDQIYNQKLKYKYNKDLWRIRVSEQSSLTKLLLLLKPYLKHGGRIRDVNQCLGNLYKRHFKIQ